MRIPGKVGRFSTVIFVIYLLMFQRICSTIFRLSRETYKFPFQVVTTWHLHCSGFLPRYSARGRSYFIETKWQQRKINNLGISYKKIIRLKAILIKMRKLLPIFTLREHKVGTLHLFVFSFLCLAIKNFLKIYLESQTLWGEARTLSAVSKFWK